MTKVCKRCGLEKPHEAFSFVRGKPGTYCKPCKSKITTDINRMRARYAFTRLGLPVPDRLKE